MPRAKTSWGFPKWGRYGADREAVTVRECDYEGCPEKADHPAPKSPLSDLKWWFCKFHAAEYNKNWNFFEGMTSEEAQAYARGDAHDGAFNTSGVYGWGGATDAGGTPVLDAQAWRVAVDEGRRDEEHAPFMAQLHVDARWLLCTDAG